MAGPKTCSGLYPSIRDFQYDPLNKYLAQRQAISQGHFANAKNTLYIIFDKHSQGMLFFLPFDESYQLDKEPEVQKWAFDEELYALVYDTLGSG